ncbi:C40 family peptidase [Pediococcus parvulus]|uniref:C40 family peptidase n=1 Tax=Pediococcus parvulus TaxID=54062 RepID=UPI00070E1587|nr:C40 family peptidase [Pediococcus parvulus]MCT3027611.1 peptidoglycan endopeptidase [Pediococcus parvulus]GEL89712.1 gamma-D-glutamate-meso-diaminopimelate muropeptidase [Pediococcus parvulus]GHC10582.1 gamma-D-glutamate-meso-diaminopimelate muropeptidase [Pediococcus parvulus]
MVKSHSNSKTTKVVLAGVAGAAGLFIAGATQTVNADSVKVAKNDTVWGISQKYNVSIKSIETLNKINQKSHLILVGQKVEIPGTTDQKQSEASSKEYIKVTVKAGDSLWQIAQDKGVSVASIKEANGLSSNLILVGQSLKAPVSGSNAAKSTAPKVEYKAASSAAQSSSTSAAGESSVSSASVSSSSKAEAASTSSSVSSVSSSSTDASSVTSESSSSAASSTTPSSSAAQSSSAAKSVASTVSSSVASSATPKSSAVAVKTAYSTSSTQSSTATKPSSAAKTTVTSAASSSSKTTASSASTKTTTTSSSSALTSGSVVSLAVKLANANIPYFWGGSTLSGMDCSGLVDYVYKNAEGISLPHNTIALESYVTTESVSAAQPGDLIFWGSKGSTYHVAIYIGNNQYVAAPQPGQNVDVETISSYFAPSFAGRVK